MEILQIQYNTKLSTYLHEFKTVQDHFYMINWTKSLIVPMVEAARTCGKLVNFQQTALQLMKKKLLI